MSKMRKIVGPALTISGLLTMASGLLMLFHLQSHLVIVLHELLSIVFVASSLVHLSLNWRALTSSLGGRRGRLLTFALVAAVTALMTVSGAMDPRGHAQHRARHGESRK